MDREINVYKGLIRPERNDDWWHLFCDWKNFKGSMEERIIQGTHHFEPKPGEEDTIPIFGHI